jgi:hypothetical protein
MAIIRVVFDWSDEKGRCYECGIPAAYTSDEHKSSPENLRCSVCAALDAAHGATITYLFDER